MLESVSSYFIEQGILGIIALILLGVVGYLFKIIMNNHTTSLQDKEIVVKALTESSNANIRMAESSEKTNELLRNLISQRPL